MKTNRRLWANNMAANPIAWRYVPRQDIPGLGGTFTRAFAGASYLDVSAVKKTVGSGVARDGHYVGGIPTLLLESAGTQVLKWASDFTNAVYFTSNVTAAKNAAGSDGITNSGSTLTFTASATAQIFQTFNPAAATYTVSVWARVASGTKKFRLRFFDAATSENWVSADFTATTTGQWFSFSHSLNADATNSSNATIRNGSDATAGDLIVSDFQVEQRAYASSAIASTTATVIRLTDTLSFAGLAVGPTATLFQRYYDLATAAWVDSGTAYTSGAAIPLTVDRAYALVAVLRGTWTTARAAALLGVP